MTYKRYFNPRFISDTPVGDDFLDNITEVPYFYTDSVRTGLCSVFERAGIHKGDTIFVPAFSPHGIVLPARKKNITVEFYKLSGDLFPDLADLEKRIVNASSPKAVFVIQYFGYLRDLKDLMEITRRHGLLLFEDRAHSFPGEFSTAASHADIEFYSFPKIFPLAEGALFIANNRKLDCRDLISGRNLFSKLAAFFNRLQLLCRTYQNLSENILFSRVLSLLCTGFNALYYVFICIPDRGSRLSAKTVESLKRFRFREACERRIALADRIISSIGLSGIKPLISTGTTSLITGIPFISPSKENIIKKFEESGIKILTYTKYWWYLSEHKDNCFSRERYIHDNHFLIPVNENMSDEDASLAVKLIKEIIGNEYPG